VYPSFSTTTGSGVSVGTGVIVGDAVFVGKSVGGTVLGEGVSLKMIGVSFGLQLTRIKEMVREAIENALTICISPKKLSWTLLIAHQYPEYKDSGYADTDCDIIQGYCERNTHTDCN